MKIIKFIPKEFASNNYLLVNEQTNNAALFDPSGCFFQIDEYIKNNNINLIYLIVTHMHFDHVGDIAKYQQQNLNQKTEQGNAREQAFLKTEGKEKNYVKMKTLAPKNDEVLYKNLTMQCDMFGVRRVEKFTIDEFIDEKSQIFLDNIEIKVIETPGHSKGSTCYLIGDNLIAGDTVFYEEIGRCDLPTGSFSDITRSIKEKLFRLDDNIKVFTGHGDNTTIGHEKEYNAYFGEKAIY